MAQILTREIIDKLLVICTAIGLTNYTRKFMTFSDVGAGNVLCLYWLHAQAQICNIYIYIYIYIYILLGNVFSFK